MPTSDEILNAARGSAPAGVAAGGATSEAIMSAARGPSDLSFLQRGIARAAGAPVDLVNDLLGIINLSSQEPFGGSRSIGRGFEALGFETPQQPPTTLGGRVAQGVGDVGGALIPFGAAANLAARGTGMAAQAGQDIMRTLAGKPLRSFAAEISAGVGSGAGGFTAQRLFGEDNEAAIATGELLGGAGLPMALSALARFSPVGLAVRTARETFVPFTEAGAFPRAQDRLRGVTGDPERALAALEGPNIGGLTPAQRTGQAGPLSLEQAVRQKNAQLDENFRVRLDQSQALLEQAMREIAPGNLENTRAFMESRRGRLLSAMDARLRQAGQAVQSRLARLKPDVRRAQSSVIVRDEIEKALEAAREQESRLYGRIDEAVTTNPQRTRDFWKETLAARDPTVDDPEDLPGFVREILGSKINQDGNVVGGTLKQAPSVTALQKLRSRILRESRAERAKDAPNRNKLRILSDLQETVLEDLEATPAGDDLTAALEFSRDLNDRFTSGAVGRMLGFERRGGPQISPEATLEQIIPRGGGPQAGQNVEQVLSAARESGITNEALEQFMLDRFNRSAITEGQLSTRSAEGFLKANEEVLNRFPRVREGIQEAIREQQSFGRTEGAIARARRRIRNQNISTTERFLGAPLGSEFQRIARAQNPAKSAAELVRQAKKDETGQALSGLKSGFLEFIMEGGIERSLSDGRVNAIANRVLSGNELIRLQRLRTELGRVAAARTARPAREGVIHDLPNQALSVVARVTGAQLGRGVAQATGGGTVQTPGIFSGQAKRFIEGLTNDKAEQLLIRALVEDEKLFRQLMTEPTVSNQRKLDQRLNAFLAGPAAELMEEDRGSQ